MIVSALYAAVIDGVLVTAAGALAIWLPAADAINHFRPWLLGVSCVLVLCTVPVRRRWLSAASLALAVVQALLLGLALARSADVATLAPTALSASRQITLVNFNIAWTRRPMDGVAAFLLQQDADIVLLQEVTNAHAQSLRPLLEEKYPHFHACGMFQGCTQAIFSKRPWVDVRDVYRATGDPEMIVAAFDDPHIGRFRLHGVHLAWPFTPATQKRHIDRLIAMRSSIAGPVIFAGDFNLTPWSFQLQRWLWTSDLRRHGHFLATWPTDGQFRLPAPLFHIDHVITTPDIKTISIQTGPRLGSDHLPVITRLELPAR